ncbi:hypothetical protein GCM10011611_61000 [Aliidongia dinghuensis]|uniref:Uncharacterized protein n=2 Tax=Aliidongia dinghuensis TaxID=1867774 RepID=A0A8J2Z0E6_9PROT|nr:hypothetical protein GCM10011611_61000 [Aliidongia dinghuensis]
MSSAIMGSTDASRSAALARSRAVTILHALAHSSSDPIVINDRLLADIDEDEKAIAELAELSLLYDARLLAVTLVAANRQSSERRDSETEVHRPLLSDEIYQRYSVRSVAVDTTGLSTEETAAEVMKHTLANDSGV